MKLSELIFGTLILTVSGVTAAPTTRHQLAYISEQNAPDGTYSIISYDVASNGDLVKFSNVVFPTTIFPSGAVHLALDKAGRFISAALYNSGQVLVYAMNQDGSVAGVPAHVHQYQGSGPGTNSNTASRQLSSHIHEIVFSKDGRYVYSPDRGSDKIWAHSYDLITGAYTALATPSVTFPPGTGPRHLVWHSTKNIAYLIAELARAVFVLDYSPSTGLLTPRPYTVSTLPSNLASLLTPAISDALNSTYGGGASSITIDTTGSYLYTTQKGTDTISVFEIDAKSGDVAKVQDKSLGGGKVAREGVLTGDGYYLAGCLGTSSVVIFRVGSDRRLAYDESVMGVVDPAMIQISDRFY
ncbi:hypothetical protein HDV00_007187 [Rhizophlyctis rosea]|nr:hypothetical protein HDV00_007187 [Rhizophlyctis rosea]